MITFQDPKTTQYFRRTQIKYSSKNLQEKVTKMQKLEKSITTKGAQEMNSRSFSSIYIGLLSISRIPLGLDKNHFANGGKIVHDDLPSIGRPLSLHEVVLPQRKLSDSSMCHHEILSWFFRPKPINHSAQGFETETAKPLGSMALCL
jgi:hypothetical protein